MNKADCSHDHICEKEKIIARLSRIEGQIRGVSSMIVEDRSCEEILTQLSAVNAAVTSTAREVLFGHIEHSVAEGIESGDLQGTVADLRSAVESFKKLK